MNDSTNAVLQALLRISLLTQLMFYRSLLASGSFHPRSQAGLNLRNVVGGGWTVHLVRAVADIDWT